MDLPHPVSERHTAGVLYHPKVTLCDIVKAVVVLRGRCSATRDRQKRGRGGKVKSANGSSQGATALQKILFLPYSSSSLLAISCSPAAA